MLYWFIKNWLLEVFCVMLLGNQIDKILVQSWRLQLRGYIQRCGVLLALSTIVNITCTFDKTQIAIFNITRNLTCSALWLWSTNWYSNIYRYLSKNPIFLFPHEGKIPCSPEIFLSPPKSKVIHWNSSESPAHQACPLTWPLLTSALKLSSEEHAEKQTHCWRMFLLSVATISTLLYQAPRSLSRHCLFCNSTQF